MSSSNSSLGGGGLPAPVVPDAAQPTGALAPEHQELIGDLMDLQTTVLVAQPWDPAMPLRLVKPGSRIGSGRPETGGLHRILYVDGHWTVVAECAAFLEMPQYVDGDGTNYVEVTRGDAERPVIADDGHGLIAAAYYLRWQKPISPELIGHYRARLDRTLAERGR